MSISWSIDPLLKVTLPKDVLVSVVEDIDLIRKAFIMAIIMAVIYPVAHIFLMHFKNYRQLEPASKQVVVLHHTIEAIILMTATPIFTYYMVKINFVLNNDDLQYDILTTILLGFVFVWMYLYELSSRFQTPRPMLIIHHLLAIFDGFLFLFFPTTVMMKTCGALLYFVCFEALTFVGLLMYRIAPLNTYTPKIIFSGLVVFGITRPLQALWVFAAAFGAWDDPNTVKWQAIMQIVLTIMLTFIQFWSLTINFTIWKRSVKRISEGSKTLSQKTLPKETLRGDTMRLSDEKYQDEEYNDEPVQEEDEDDDIGDWFDATSVDSGFVSFVQFLNVPNEGKASSQDQTKEYNGSHTTKLISTSVLLVLVVALYATIIVKFPM